MGSEISQLCRDQDLTILVTTGMQKGAGTDANVWTIIHDDKGHKTDVIKLDHAFKDDHERGQTCKFTANTTGDFGKPHKIEFWRDSFGIAPNWFVEKVEVIDNVHGTKHIFPVQRWISADRHYIIREYDCSLPQENEHDELELRRMEITEYRRIYQYALKISPTGPVQVKVLPDDGKFTDEYQLDMLINKYRLILETKLIQLTTDRWKSLQDLKKIYKLSLGEPHCLECWNEDSYFGLQRVQGTNPMLITLCKRIPDKFAVDSNMLEPFLEGLTLDGALKNNRIFYVDLHYTEGVECKDNNKLCSPFGLFFLNDNKELMPIAIQLLQDPGPNNPVFLPSDPHNTWLLAKMYFNNADCAYHQGCTHLGFTHLVMEGICVCTHRNLSPSHPLYKLMAPHFLFLMAINARGLKKLISPNGWVDRTMTLGRKGMFNLITKAMTWYRLNVHGNVPKELEARGVDDPLILPHYPYRDDAVRLYRIIERYVTKIVKHFYDSSDKILHDYELQQWRLELVKDRNLGGCGILGVPGEEKDRFTTVEEIIDAVTVVISACSLNHAAGNFQQYDEYAFPPNYPSILYGEWPTDKTALTEQDILDRLPNRETTMDIMAISRLLSNKATRSLGNFESRYMYDPFCSQAAEEFRKELAKMSADVKIRNRTQRVRYHWLDPEFIPNSISI